MVLELKSLMSEDPTSLQGSPNLGRRISKAMPGLKIIMDSTANKMSDKTNKNIKQINITQGQFDESIALLDNNLNRMLKKHEFEYVQSYNIYVKNKEREMV